MKKRFILFLTLILISAFMNVSCTSQKTQMPIKLGSMPTLSAAIYAVGIEKGIFKQHDLSVELTIFKSAPERDAAATAGELDGFMTDIMGVVNLVDKGFNFKITSYEYENFGVMANKQFVDRNNKVINNDKIGLSKNTVIEYVVDEVLEDTNVEKVEMVKIPDRLAAVLSDELQLGVFPEPFISIIKAKGGLEIMSSAQEGIQPVVLVFNDKAIDSKDDEIKAFYKAYNESVQYLKETPYDDYKNILIQYGLISEELVDVIKLPLEQFSNAKMTSEEDFNKVMEWMLEKGIVENQYTLENISVNRYVK